MLPTFNKTITILNKLSAKDSPDKKDHWKAATINNCAWTCAENRTVNGSEVSIGGNVIVRIPENRKYSPYEEWKNNGFGFTISLGDFVVLGEIRDEITDENVVRYAVEHRNKCFKIRFFKDNSGMPLGHYRIEGV